MYTEVWFTLQIHAVLSDVCFIIVNTQSFETEDSLYSFHLNRIAYIYSQT